MPVGVGLLRYRNLLSGSPIQVASVSDNPAAGNGMRFGITLKAFELIFRNRGSLIQSA
jgi:hypothetical protein